MTARITIQHTNGTKVNQIEQFPLETTTEISFGRDPGNTVTFDAQRDDAASRKHAVLRISGGERPNFTLADLNSANGTFINGSRLNGEQELMPGDTVEFGSGGPKCVFDVQPRPAHLMARTRIIQTPAVGPATRISAVGMQDAAPGPTRVGVGRETVQRMLSEQKRSTTWTWMYVLAAVLVLVGAGGIWLKVSSDRAKRDEDARLAAAQAALATSIHQEETARQAKMGLSSEDIARKFGNATVQIFVAWRAIDKDTGRPLYHKVAYFTTQDHKRVALPCYVDIPKVGIVRWLTSEDEDHNNHLVGGAAQGSGFVVSSNGFIMTNKHVAAGWRMPYLTYSGEYEDGRGLVFELGDRRARSALVNLSDSDDGEKTLKEWVPADGAVIFDPRRPIAIAASKNQVTGENLELSVRFPGNPGAIQAKLVSSAEDADAAEIKIDTQQDLSAVSVANDDSVRVGQRVTVLGFPGFSTETHALRTSIEGGQVHQFNDVVPEPTVTEGLISLLSPPQKQIGDVTVLGDMGDAYQLTVPTSHGNSGGPVFDQNGKVIALFTYGDPRRETHTFAVPIRYARDLIQMQRTAN